MVPCKTSLLLERCQQPSQQTPSPGCGPTQECAIIGNGCSSPGWEPDNTAQRKEEREEILRPLHHARTLVHPPIGLGWWADPGFI